MYIDIHLYKSRFKTKKNTKCVAPTLKPDFLRISKLEGEKWSHSLHRKSDMLRITKALYINCFHAEHEF